MNITEATQDPRITVALVGASVSFLVATLSAGMTIASALISYRHQREILQLKTELEKTTADQNAVRDYQYEAKKRLLEECGPLLFQLTETAERAKGRLLGLVRTARKGDLEPPKSWLDRGYYRLSSMYRMLAPLAVGELIRGRLTHLDLSLDHSIRNQVNILKNIRDSFGRDFAMAEYAPTLEYDPYHQEWASKAQQRPQAYWQQGVPRGIMEAAIGALLRDEDGIKTLKSYGEFENDYNEADSPTGKLIGRIEYLVDGFTPKDRPVLWRIMVLQIVLYDDLARARVAHMSMPQFELSEDDIEALTWGPDDHSRPEGSEDTMMAIKAYIEERVAPAFLEYE